MGLIYTMQAFKRFVPLADRILVQRLAAETKSTGGLLLPESAKEEMNQAKVLAMGGGRRNQEGNLIPMGTKVGDTVIIPRYGGTEVKLDGEEYQIFRTRTLSALLRTSEV